MKEKVDKWNAITLRGGRISPVGFSFSFSLSFPTSLSSGGFDAALVARLGGTEVVFSTIMGADLLVPGRLSAAGSEAGAAVNVNVKVRQNKLLKKRIITNQLWSTWITPRALKAEMFGGVGTRHRTSELRSQNPWA